MCNRISGLCDKSSITIDTKRYRETSLVCCLLNLQGANTFVLIAEKVNTFNSYFSTSEDTRNLESLCREQMSSRSAEYIVAICPSVRIRCMRLCVSSIRLLTTFMVSF